MNTAFRRSSSTAFPGHPDQDAIAIPGVIQLMVADVNVISTVIPDGKAKTFAAATQPRVNKILSLIAHQAFVSLTAEDTELAQPVNGQVQTFFISFVGQLEDLGQRGLGNRLVVGELIQEVSDRELHGG